ncbi:hypothetical protein KDA_39460 [Dictyobacter alpinus]|uniref:HTH luxR-type domain-containing protein n=2 Tax=Dictyobacter alpinus TaxID=2014873 RepID=A0A402BAZ4_9CHLR|nr:hypothetical protein KDA_39460 [Dictyobacter alpinus]
MPTIRKHIPVVVDEYLYIPDQMSSATQTVFVGSPDWYAWLADGLHPSFSFKHAGGTFTARQERQRRGWYWYAYRKRAGQVLKTYLGRPKELTKDRLAHAASVLALKEVKLPADKKPTTPLHSPVLDEKFSIPRSAIESIERPQLLQRITAGVKGKLVLLSAAAGWGKTSLLSSWCSSKYAPNWPLAWVSLDIHDNEPRDFWTHLLTALNIAHAGTFDEILTRIRHMHDVQDEQFLKLLLSACQQITTDSVLILDNYDCIQSTELKKQLTFMLEHLPVRLHLIIASRTNPSFPLSRLRVEGALTELRNANLRFTPEETTRLLQKMPGLAISAESCAAIAAQTEGWIAGIQLYALHIKEQDLYDSREQTNTTRNRYIMDYICEEILFKQSDELQEFLLQTSIAHRLNASLCNSLREKEDGQSWIDQLLQLNLISEDKQEHSYQYPQLLRNALYQQLRRTRPALLTDLQQRVSSWYAQQDIHRPARPEAPLTLQLVSPALLREQQPTSEESRVSNEPQLPRQPKPQDMPENLTRRERDVLHLLVNGASNRDIAQNLILSEGTVKKHVSNICNKLGVQSRTQAVAKSLALSLVNPH